MSEANEPNDGETSMNGAQALIQTLVDSGVDTCFMNPGTSEMHFVAALDDVPQMRGVLTLFEGVATGAADGFGRMADRPASTLLHLGPGLGNGIANLHNARRARTPLVNIVGDHATYHKELDAPLESDIAALAGNVSGWVHTSQSSDSVAQDTANAVAAASGSPGQVATLILPADVCWNQANGSAPPVEVASSAGVPENLINQATAILKTGQANPGSTALLLGGSLGQTPALEAASRICRATGAKLLTETFPTRLARGAGIPAVERLAYLAEFAQMQLDGIQHLFLVGSTEPVSFFAYPDKPGRLAMNGCEIHVLSAPDQDGLGALQAIADLVGAPANSFLAAPASRPELPTGTLDAQAVGQVVGALMPEGAIISDEANTAGIFLPGSTAGAPPHDWLCLTGGAIGQGMPLATGAAMASPGRRVINVEADGSAMFTLQALWTQAREGLDVTTIILNNGSYAVLKMELDRVGAQEAGPLASAMLDISQPRLDFVSLAAGMGVPATRATTAEEFVNQLQKSLASEGPSLIEAMVPASL